MWRRGVLVLSIACCVSAQPSEVDRAFARAVQLYQGGDLDSAVREYRAVLALQPSRVDARSNLGAALAKLGRYQEAVDEYRQALTTAPPDAALHLRLNLALAYYKSFQLVQAVTELSKLHKEQPNETNVTLLLADCDLRLGEFKQAIALLAPLETSQPDNRAITYMLGMALIRDGQVAEGQKRVDLILRDGDSAESRLLLGTAMFMAHDYPAAVNGFARAIELNPKLPSVQSFYGQALLATGDADGAMHAFQQELATNPNDYDANFQLAEILTHRKQFKQAEPFLRRAALLRPGAALVAGSRAPAQPPTGVAIGTAAPNFSALEKYRGKKPVVVVFGSYTCPNFRHDVPALNGLYQKYAKAVAFELVYIREAHTDTQWQSTINERQGVDMHLAASLVEKQDHAGICVRKLNIAFPALVDGMDGNLEAAYDAWPSRVYLVGKDGRVLFNSRLGELSFEPAQLEAAIQSSLY